jgi:hypothetical protein
LTADVTGTAAVTAASVLLPVQCQQRDVVAAASDCQPYAVGTKVNGHSLKQLLVLLLLTAATTSCII